MKLFGTGRSKKQDVKVGLVFDIGSASVAGALVVFRKEMPPRLLYVVRKPISFQKELNFSRFVNSLFATFTAVVESIEHKGLNYLNEKQVGPDAISHALCMYASPWYAASTKVLTLEKEKPFTVTQTLIDRIVDRELTSEEQDIHGSGDIIEQTITAIKVNGYNITQVEGKLAKTLELTVSTTMLSHAVARGIEDILAGAFHNRNIQHHSFPLATFTTMRDLREDTNTFLLLDVSGEVSDLSLVKEGALLETVSFPKGTHFITRQLMEAHDLSAAEARSRIRMYADDTTTVDISDVITDIARSWADSFNQALEQMETDLQRPGTLFFITDREYMPVIQGFIEYADKDTTLELESIGYKILRKEIDFSGDKTQDSFVGIGSYFLNKMLWL